MNQSTAVPININKFEVIVDGVGELVDPKIEAVSLVKRPASRVPLEKFKSDQGNLMKSKDLSAIAQAIQKSQKPDDSSSPQTPPSIVSVVIKADKAESLSNIIPKDLTEKSESEGFITFSHPRLKSEEVETGEIFLSSDVAVRIEKGLSWWGDTLDFETNLQQRQASSGIWQHIHALTDVIDELEWSGLLNQEFKDVFNQAIDDFAASIKGFVSGLPDEVFKMEGALHAVEKGERTLVEPNPTSTSQKSESLKEATQKLTHSTQTLKSKSDNNEIQGLIVSVISPIQETLNQLAESITAITDNQNALQEEVTKSQNQINSLESDLNGSLPPDDPGEGEPVKKSEDPEPAKLTDRPNVEVR